VNQDVASNELKPYILTARHCGNNAELSTIVFRFNFQYATCTAPGLGTYDYYTTVGCEKRADRLLYDMFLLELNEFPPPDYNVHFSGWDRREKGDLTNDMLGIHHPKGHRKKVSLGSLKSNINPAFWRVEWDRNDSPTLKGSSGSPLYEDEYDRLIGWLSYGRADCDHEERPERYGKLRKAWTGGASDGRLKDWLDPNDNDEESIDGRDPCFTDLVISNRTFRSAQQHYQPENAITVQAGKTLATSGTVTISTKSEYKFTAGETIRLRSGFRTFYDLRFHATLETCDILAKNTTPDYVGKPVSDVSLKVYPNPFSHVTTVEFTVTHEESVNISVFNSSGELVRTIANNKQVLAGTHQFTFESTELSAGIYICRVVAGDFVEQKRIVLMK